MSVESTPGPAIVDSGSVASRPRESAESDWRSIDWSRHERQLRIGGRRLSGVDLGCGAPTCVLVHGLGGCWQHWLETAPSLAAAHRVIALDVPGFGRSELPPPPFSVEGLVDALETACERLMVNEAVVFCHSVGTCLGILLAARRPDLVRGLLLVGGPVLTSTLAMRLAAVWGARVARFVVRGPGCTAANGLSAHTWAQHELLHRACLRQRAFARYFSEPQLVCDDLLVEIMQSSGARGVRPAVRAFSRIDLTVRLDEVRCPTLVLNGALDRIVRPRDLGLFRTRVPHARFVELERAGHSPMLERPTEFNRLASSFVTAGV